MNPDAPAPLAPRAGSASCCERELVACGKAYSGKNKDGEPWACPKCGAWWQYVEDEAEGGAWHPHNASAYLAAGVQPPNAVGKPTPLVGGRP